MTTPSDTPVSPLRILVVDDHGLFRIGLRQLLEQEGFAVVEADTVPAELRRSAGRAPDVVVVGVNRLAECEGDAIDLLAEALPSSPVLVLALVLDAAHVRRVVRSGVRGYLLKGAELGEIVTGIRDLADGQSVLSPAVARVVIDALCEAAEPPVARPALDARQLSERERTVLSLLADGYDNQEIGERLFLSRSTVKNHVSHLLEKLEVDNRVQAATYAVRCGLV